MNLTGRIIALENAIKHAMVSFVQTNTTVTTAKRLSRDEGQYKYSQCILTLEFFRQSAIMQC
jgi:hypothetical protein